MVTLKEVRKALEMVKRRKFCAHWLIKKPLLRQLLKQRLVVPCGFYSVCLPEDKPTFPISIEYAEPEKAFQWYPRDRNLWTMRTRSRVCPPEQLPAEAQEPPRLPA
jgi:hypothetical protein